MEQLPHCTTLFYHIVPRHLAEEPTGTMPKGGNWVVHFMNCGPDTADLVSAQGAGPSATPVMRIFSCYRRFTVPRSVRSPWQEQAVPATTRRGGDCRNFEATREMGLIMSKSGAYRNVRRMMPPLCIHSDDIAFFSEAIDQEFCGGSWTIVRVMSLSALPDSPHITSKHRVITLHNVAK